MGCDRPDLLSGVFRSFLGSWNGVLQTDARNGFCGCSAGHQRWGRVSTALWLNWKVPATCWRLGEGSWMSGRAGGGLEKEMAVDRIFWQKRLQVFEVGGLVCGEDEAWGSLKMISVPYVLFIS